MSQKKEDFPSIAARRRNPPRQSRKPSSTLSPSRRPSGKKSTPSHQAGTPPDVTVPTARKPRAASPWFTPPAADPRPAQPPVEPRPSIKPEPREPAFDDDHWRLLHNIACRDAGVDPSDAMFDMNDFAFHAHPRQRDQSFEHPTMAMAAAG